MWERCCVKKFRAVHVTSMLQCGWENSCIVYLLCCLSILLEKLIIPYIWQIKGSLFRPHSYLNFRYNPDIWFNLHFERRYSALCLNTVDSSVLILHPLVINRAHAGIWLWASLPWKVQVVMLFFWGFFLNCCKSKVFKKCATCRLSLYCMILLILV